MKTIKETGLSFAMEELMKLIPEGNDSKMLSILLKAIEIEKKQILDAYYEGWAHNTHTEETVMLEAERYYNEVYNVE